MRKISIWIIIILLLPLIFIVWKIVKADTNDNIPQQRKYSNKSVNICDWGMIRDIAQDSLLENFPYDKYLDSSNYWSIQPIKENLSCLDTLFESNISLNRETLSNAFTRKLAPRFNSYLSTYQPDSLLLLIQWAEKFKYYAEIDPDNDLFYESIYGYWMDTISNKLTRYTIEKPSRKYDFKFKYIRTRCVEQRFSPATKITSSEKAFNNFIYSKWGHLINASWNQTSVMQKIIFVFLIILTLFGYYLLGKRIFTFFLNLFKND